jgi:DNA-binding response OmpR family regulator
VRVLVVDDEIIIADTLAMILRGHGFDALAVYSGELAISTAITMKPDLLISDLMMLGLDGIDTAVQIRSLMPECKVILHSGHVNMSDPPLRDRLEEHSLEVLPKPLHPHTLLKRIYALCAGWTGPTVMPGKEREMAQSVITS